ncbi:uncharacterized protein LOC143861983 [Tasmannia lanceolata]|uniref:uncharacterized protein LOC143861983 n=1 Tax=Tasmannia lanceolata TaxID=3420 RepID=UPI004062B2FF
MRITRSKSRLKMSNSQSHVPQPGPGQSKRNTRSKSSLKMSTSQSHVPQPGPGQSKRNARSRSRLSTSQSHVPQSGPSQSQQSQPPQPFDSQASHPEKSQCAQPQDSRATDSGVMLGVKYIIDEPYAINLDVWDLPLEQRIYVKLDEFGHPISREQATLEFFVDSLVNINARKLPIDVHDWRKVPHAIKEKMWVIVQGVFDIDNSGKVWFLEYLHKKWREFKFYLKKMYFVDYNATDAELLALIDNRVDPNQWRNLVTYWNCKLGKAHNEVNKFSRAKYTINYTERAKRAEDDRKHEEKWIKYIGEETLRVVLYLPTTPVDYAPPHVMKDLNEFILSPNTGEERSGRVSTSESGPSSSDIGSVTSNPVKSQKISSEAKIGIDEIKAQVAKMEENFVLMQAQLKEMVSVINKVPNAHVDDVLNKVLGSTNSSDASS